MSDPTLTFQQAQAADEAKARDIAMFERRLRLLERASEVAIRNVETFTPGAAPADPPRADPTMTLASATKALCTCIAWETKVHRDLRDVRAGIERQRAQQAIDRIHLPDYLKPKTANEAHQNRAHDMVYKVIKTEARTEDDFCQLLYAMDERFEYDWSYHELGNRPVRETVERLCRDLGMNPDMSRWDDATEGWINDGPPKRPAFSHFHSPSRIPLCDDSGDLLEPAQRDNQDPHALE